jgi:molybdate transport repressor ModE-like protein
MSLPATPHPLNEALGHAASDKRLEVLRRVGQTGSISQAARDAGISYKAAWQAIDTLTNLSGLPLVDRSVGGSGGGGARITPDGLRLLGLADQLADARAQVLARFGLLPVVGLSRPFGLWPAHQHAQPVALLGGALWKAVRARVPLVCRWTVRTSGGSTTDVMGHPRKRRFAGPGSWPVRADLVQSHGGQHHGWGNHSGSIHCGRPVA